MKKSSLNASILHDTNLFMATSDEDWGSLRQGTSIRFGQDSIYYSVAKTEKFLYIKDFEIIEPFRVVINGDTGIIFLKGDSIDLSYKEAELNSFQIKSGGKNHYIGEKIQLIGGIASSDLFSGRSLTTTFIVAKINDDKSVSELKVEQAGRYIVLPEKFEFEGVELDASFKVSDHRSIIERTVQKVDYENGKTYLTFTYPLSPGIKSGKVSVNKWRGYLSSNYVGDSKIEQPYDAIRDFTPHFNIPLIVKNHPNPEMIYNQSLKLLDAKLKELENKLTFGIK